jgi:hypothetical protein
MYSIETLTGDRWAVIGEGGQTACVGTMRQCEDWLDYQQNRRATSLASFPRISRRANSRFLTRTVVGWAIGCALGLYALFLCQSTVVGAGSASAATIQTGSQDE